MLKNLPFSYKIALLPMVSAAAFLIILYGSWYNTTKSAKIVETIETGYFAWLNVSGLVLSEIEYIHRSFQDSATIGDRDILDEVEELRLKVDGQLHEGRSNLVVDQKRLEALIDDFDAYYKLAFEMTLAMINGSEDSAVFDNVIVASEKFFAVKAEILKWEELYKKKISEQLAISRAVQDSSNHMLLLVASICGFVLVIISYFIISMLSKSLKMALTGIDGLSEGDLSQKPDPTSHDEMGQMVYRIQDVTGTVNDLTTELHTLVVAVREGRLDKRGDPTRFKGAYVDLVENINHLIDAFVHPISVTADYVQRISEGNMPAPITEHYRGDFNQTKSNLNQLISSMTGVLHETELVTQSSRRGDLTQRANVGHFSGAWKDLASGINETLDAVCEPIKAVTNVMNNIANGDLSKTIDANYQGDFATLANDVNATIEKLIAVIGQIQRSGGTVNSNAREIADATQNLNTRTAQQAKSLEDASHNMEEMIGLVVDSAKNAHQANELADDAQERAKLGVKVVGTVINAMSAINNSSKRIADIVTVIDELAFQTNLLALNAAVEAARAGEEGKGFAVVANEVGVLANRSAVASKEIRVLILDSLSKVDEGSRLVGNSGETLKSIEDSVINVNNVINQIANASHEQSAKIQGVNQTITEMEGMTMKNTTMVEEAAAVSESMEQEAERLSQMVDFFTLPAGENGSYHGIKKAA